MNRLVAAADRGLDVQVSLSDDRVSSYEDDYTEEAAYRLDQAGVIVTWCSSSFTYTHAKFWIVDSQDTFVYTGNWAPSSIPQVNYARTNRELGFMFDDASIATFYENESIYITKIRVCYSSKKFLDKFLLMENLDHNKQYLLHNRIL